MHPFKTSAIQVCLRVALILAAMLLPLHPVVQGQENHMHKPARILFLLDGSSSMLNDWQHKETRFATAARIIERITDSVYKINPKVAFALRVYGTQYPAQDKNCYDSRLEVPFGYKNAAQIQTRLKYLTAKGYSPIAWSLEQAAVHDFVNSDQYAYSIILLTDGGESCGGDICQTVTQLVQQKISFQPYILSLVDYAPLRDQYDCMGKLLTVAKEGDIQTAVQTILHDNRILFKEGASKIHPEPIAVTREEQQPTPVATTPERPVSSEMKEVAAIPVSRQPARQQVNRSPAPGGATRSTSRVTLAIPLEPEAITRPVLPVFKRVSINTKPRRANILYTLPIAQVRKLPKLVLLQIPLETVPQPPASKQPAVRSRQPPKTIEEKDVAYTLSTEEAKDTRLQVFFTNGKGKYYNTEPKMVFLDSKSQKQLKTAYRNMMVGAPDPILLASGTYDIQIPGSKATARNVHIQPNKLNSVTILVGHGSIAFHYPTNTRRPVEEYQALVSKRFEGGPVVKQACDTELPYDPTNYHVEINTLPPLIYNVDVGFNEVKLLAVPEAGKVVIINTELMGKIQFWFQMGGDYVPFYDMVINGNPATQTVSFRPGNYQVRYYQHGSTPASKPAVIGFSVVSNQTTEVKLIP